MGALIVLSFRRIPKCVPCANWRIRGLAYAAAREPETLPGYFVTIRRVGALGVGVGGEIVNVTQVFQPWGRFSAANSL